MNRRVLASLLGLGALALAVLPASTRQVAANASASDVTVVADSPIVNSPNAADPRANPGQPATVPAAPPLSGPSAVGDLLASNFDRMPTWKAPAGYEGSWRVMGGRLQQTGDATGDGSFSNGRAALANDLAALNGTVRVMAYPTSGESFGVLFRGTASAHYRLTFFPAAPNNKSKAIMERVTTGTKTGTRASTVGQAPVRVWPGYTPGRWHDVRVALQGARVEVLVDGASVLSYTDPAPAAGWSGLWGTADQGVSFDNFAQSSVADFAASKTPANDAPDSQAAAPAAPQADWSTPLNVSNSPLYDQTPALAVSAAGAASVVWMRDDPDNVDKPASYLMAASGSSTAPFSSLTASTAFPRGLGNVRTARDAQGKVHAAYYELIEGYYQCGRYTQLDAAGNFVLTETVPNTCGSGRKNVAIAVGPTGNVNILFGANNRDAYFYQRSAAGTWTVEGEEVTADPVADLSIVESKNGVVMAAYKGPGPGGNGDIITARRDGAGTWVKEDISAQCCTGCPEDSRAYLPNLAAAPDGGLRISWSDENCEPRQELTSNDIYYREWVPGTGWEGKPMVRVVQNAGHSYFNDMAVDNSGAAHILWGDTTDHNFFALLYATGKGTTFSVPVAPWDAWVGAGYAKDPSIETSTGMVHVSFGSNKEDPLKDNYYTYLPIYDGPAATPTPTATPVNCLFADVCETDYFYSAVKALNKAGVLSGYAANPPCDAGTPCFRPYDNMTRAQSVKVVALGAGWQLLNPSSNSFADVAVGSTFYKYVETAASRGVISGYACGGTGETCDSQKRPYLRPGGKVTRGQFTKMVVSGFDMQLNPGNTPHFTDVAVGSTFFQYIETAYTGGLISGYSDGTFRPNDNVTRGQASKVVYIARGNK